MKQFTFYGNENQNTSSSYLNSRHDNGKSSSANFKVEQIKRKYDTPSRRQRLECLNKSKDYAQIQPKMKQNYESSYDALKKSYAINRTSANHLSSVQTEIDQNDVKLRDRTNDIKLYKRQDEQAFFKRMKEMKQSLYNDHSRVIHQESRVDKKMNDKGLTNLNEVMLKKDNRLDPRVENIDKINSKIKQILHCLNANEKQRPSKFMKNDQLNTESVISVKQSARFGTDRSRQLTLENHQKTKFYEKSDESTAKMKQIENSGEKVWHQNSEVLDKIRIISNQKQTKDTKFRQQIPNLSKFKIQQNQNQHHQKTNHVFSRYSEGLGERKSALDNISEVSVRLESNYNRKILQCHDSNNTTNGVELKKSRSKSYLQSIKRQHIKYDKSSQINNKSAKKINDEINKIYKKIQHFQEEKKKLNIQFTPFKYPNNNKFTTILVKDIDKEKINPNFINLTNDIQTHENQNDYSFEDKSARKINNEYISHVKGQRSRKSPQKNQKFRIKLIPIENDVPDTKLEKNYSKASLGYNIDEMKKKTGEGMEERKNKLKMQENKMFTQNTIKNLVYCLCQQVKEDEEYRNHKIWLENLLDPKKYQKIGEELKKRYQIQMSKENLQYQFKSSEEQNNPFFSVQSCSSNFKNTVESYYSSKQNWARTILHKFSRNKLQEQNFTEKKIDLEKKKYIELQDLVRFLNIESGTFYRNRDLILIFKRINSQSTKISFKEIMDVICFQ